MLGLGKIFFVCVVRGITLFENVPTNKEIVGLILCGSFSVVFGLSLVILFSFQLSLLIANTTTIEYADYKNRKKFAAKNKLKFSYHYNMGGIFKNISHFFGTSSLLVAFLSPPIKSEFDYTLHLIQMQKL